MTDYKAGYWIMLTLLFITGFVTYAVGRSYRSQIADLKAQNAQLEAAAGQSIEAMKAASESLTACTDEREKWKRAALAEYEAIQKLQANQAREVDWSAILKTVAVLLK